MDKPVELSEVQFEATYFRPDGTKPGFQTMISRATNQPRKEATQYTSGWRIQMFPTYIRFTHPDTWDHFVPLSRVIVALGK